MKKNLKNFGLITIMFMIFIVLPPTSVFATKYAYSIGSLWDSSIPGLGGSNYTSNVISAANIYSQISNVTSYYNTEATYSYMTGNSPNGQRRIASYIVFLNGHANPSAILTAASNSANSRTGVHTGYDGSTQTINGLTFTYAGLSSTNMSPVKLIVFAGCSTGQYPNYGNNTTSTNLPLKAVERGANVAVGFRDAITSRFLGGPEWLNTFNNCIKNGYGVDGAITAACVAYPNSDLSQYAMAEGNIYPSVLSVAKGLFAQNDLETQYYTVSGNDIEFTRLENDIYNEDLSGYTNEFSSIIEKIKESDKTFDVKNYKVTYNKINEEHGFEHIYFTQYIGENIETNKVYLIVIKNGQPDSIILSGITKANLKTMQVNVDNLNNKISAFEKDKTQKLNNMSTSKLNLSKAKLCENNLIDKLSLDENIDDVTEKYYYDYNTNTLKYVLKCIKNCDLNLKTVEGVEIDL